MSEIRLIRTMWPRSLGTGIAIIISLVSPLPGRQQENPPNIVLVMIDNVGYGDFGFSGNEQVRTPNLDKFGAEGIQFSRFYCNPMCAPTRASLMTGRYYYRTGVIHTSRGGALMAGEEKTIAEYLKAVGYATGMFGKWHLGDNFPMRPMDQGFDETVWHKSGRIGQVPDSPNTYINPSLWHNDKKVQKSGYCTDIFFNEAMSFIERHRERPVFVYLPTNVGHTAKEALVGPLVPERYSDFYRARGLNASVSKVYGMVDNFDENFGRLVAKLENLGLRENTLVIFTSDDGPGHGYNAGLRIGTVYEARIRVPLFVQWPSRLRGGQSTDRIASHIDILPTLLDICGIPVSEDYRLDGLSLLPLLEGRVSSWPHRTLFFQCHRGLSPKRYQNSIVMTQRYKMVGYPETFNEEDLWTSSEEPVLELFDLSSDPGEINDLASILPKKLESLRSLYDSWFNDVWRTRDFTPGRIHIGSDRENPVHLCRYQDSAYVDGKPTGWLVDVERPGEYEFTINRGPSAESGMMFLRFNEALFLKTLAPKGNRATFVLPAGEGRLDVWVQEEGKPYVPRSEENTVGDVDVRRLSKIHSGGVTQ